jgi:hypothetical protein
VWGGVELLWRDGVKLSTSLFNTFTLVVFTRGGGGRGEVELGGMGMRC